MANWAKLTLADGGLVYLNLELAIRIRPAEDGTSVGFSKSEGVVLYTVKESLADVMQMAMGPAAPKTPEPRTKTKGK